MAFTTVIGVTPQERQRSAADSSSLFRVSIWGGRSSDSPAANVSNTSSEYQRDSACNSPVTQVSTIAMATANGTRIRFIAIKGLGSQYSLDAPPAIDFKTRPGDELGLVRGEEHC